MPPTFRRIFKRHSVIDLIVCFVLLSLVGGANIAPHSGQFAIRASVVLQTSQSGQSQCGQTKMSISTAGATGSAGSWTGSSTPSKAKTASLTALT